MTQELVRLLEAESEEVRKRAGVLREMAAEGGDESQKASAMAGGVAPLVSLLKGLSDGRLEAQEYALWSLSLVTDSIRVRPWKCREGILLVRASPTASC